MRPCLSVLVLGFIAILPAGMAAAQDKIAPTRTYGGDRNYGKEFGATYSNKSRLPPEKGFGLPSMARPGAGPEQQQGLVKGATAPTNPLPNDAATPTPNEAKGSDANTFGLPELAPNHEGTPPASPSSNTDFFAHTTEFDLPKTGSDTGTSDTPLYTTREPAALGGTEQTTPDSDASDRNAFGAASFGSPPAAGSDANANKQKPAGN